jgi:hypothetical protein
MPLAFYFGLVVISLFSLSISLWMCFADLSISVS